MSDIESYAQQLIEDPTNSVLAECFISSLRADDGLFHAQEDDLFDYKLEYPHSMTDSYFSGICRILFAMHNSFGGVVVLGVDDQKRSGGHNKKIVKIERLNTRLRELSGASVNVRHHHLILQGEDGDETKDPIDLLIVPKRPPSAPPVALLKNLDKYSEGTIWMRRGHEVLEANSRDTGFLFGPRDSNSDDGANRVPSYLPSAPATISNFVGRVDTLSELFTWISSQDEPRKFLWGRGGSGKSTIAYEFAKIVRDNGKIIQGYDGNPFERVVFLSAKEKELYSEKGQIQSTKYVDFSNFRELLTSLLVASDYSAEEKFSLLEIEELEERVKELFNFESMLIVIDDIDTLVTKGEEAGFDRIFKLAIRAKKCVRILYTQRNQHLSSENSIEVTGFKKDKHFREFVENCCKQFKVPLPEEHYMLSNLKKDTEGIPLIVETIIGLRKTAGKYSKAHQIFLNRRGDEARKYLFEREYEALGADNKARNVLATIAEFARPVANEEILAIVQFGENSVIEAIGEVLGFFLSTEISAEGTTKYYVNPVTRAFLKEKTASLDFGKTLVERVKNFKSEGRRKSKEVVILESRIRRCLNVEDIETAVGIVSSETSSAIIESAAFRMLRAEVFALCQPPRVTEAREDFQYCVDHGYENAEGMRRWMDLERNAHSSLNQVKVCDHVILGKSYADKVKNEFYSRKATVLYYQGRDVGLGTIDAFNLFRESLLLSVKAFNFFHSAGSDSIRNFRNVRGTAFSLVNTAKTIEFDKELLKVFDEIQNECGYLSDPLHEPFLDFLRFLAITTGGATRKRRDGLQRSIAARIGKSLSFEIPELNQECLRVLRENKFR